MEIDLPFMIAIGLAVSVWAIVLAHRLPILYACLFALTAVSCFGVAFAQWKMGPFTASLDRLMFVFVVALVGVKRLLTPQPRMQWERSDLLLVGLMGILLASLWTHPTPPRIGTMPAPEFIFATSFLAPALLYWIARYRASDAKDLGIILRFFLLFGLYLAFTAVCEAHQLSALVVPSYILTARRLYAGRSVGPFLSAPALGTWVTVAALCAVLLWSRTRGIAKGLVLLTLPLFTYAQYLTQTRSGWIGFVLAVPLAFFLCGNRMLKQFMAVVMIAGALVVGVFLGDKFFLPERAEGRGVVAYSTSQRLALLQKSLALFVQKPIQGWGYGHFEHAAQTSAGGGPLQLVSGSASEGLASHNMLLRFIAETGVVGTVPFVCLFGTWINQTRRALASSEPSSPQRLLAILFLGAFIAYWAEAMFHDVTFIYQDTLLLFFLAGCFRSAQVDGQE